MTLSGKKRKLIIPDFSKTVQNLENKLVKASSANSSLNSLADLVNLLNESNNPYDISKAIHALYRVFVIIITTGKLTVSGGDDAKAVRTWIWGRLNSYVDFLVCLLKDEETFLRVCTSFLLSNYVTQLLQISALQILFSLLKHLSTSSTKSSTQPQFHLSHFKKIVSGLLMCPSSKRALISSIQSPGDAGKTAANIVDLFI